MLRHLLLVCVLVLNGMPAYSAEEIEISRIENVDRIFMQTESEYVLMVRSGDFQWKFKTLYLKQGNYYEPKLIADVSAGKPMWVRMVRHTLPPWMGLSQYKFETEFHIHGVSSIEGGGWLQRIGRHSEHRMTQVVE